MLAAAMDGVDARVVLLLGADENRSLLLLLLVEVEVEVVEVAVAMRLRAAREATLGSVA